MPVQLLGSTAQQPLAIHLPWWGSRSCSRLAPHRDPTHTACTGRCERPRLATRWDASSLLATAPRVAGACQTTRAAAYTGWIAEAAAAGFVDAQFHSRAWAYPQRPRRGAQHKPRVLVVCAGCPPRRRNCASSSCQAGECVLEIDELAALLPQSRGGARVTDALPGTSHVRHTSPAVWHSTVTVLFFALAETGTKLHKNFVLEGYDATVQLNKG